MLKTITLENYEKVLSTKSTMLLYFWSESCGASRILTPVIHRLHMEYDDKLLVATINIDKELELSKLFQIKSTPAVYILNNGKLIGKAIGVKPGAFYRKMLKKVNE